MLRSSFRGFLDKFPRLISAELSAHLLIPNQDDTVNLGGLYRQNYTTQNQTFNPEINTLKTTFYTIISPPYITFLLNNKLPW